MADEEKPAEDSPEIELSPALSFRRRAMAMKKNGRASTRS
jgi:hypothetical protein